MIGYLINYFRRLAKSWKDSTSTTPDRAIAQSRVKDMSPFQGLVLTLWDIHLRILNYLKINPTAGRREITLNITGITENGVKYNLRRLKELGLIKRIGSPKGGRWEINTSLV